MRISTRDLAKNIIYLGKKKGLKKGELERLAGVSAGYLSRTIKGNMEMSLNKVYSFADALEMEIGELLSFSPLQDEQIDLENEIEELQSQLAEKKKRLHEIDYILGFKGDVLEVKI